MNRSGVVDNIGTRIEEIKKLSERFKSIGQDGTIPQVEIDLTLSKIRDLYDSVLSLNNLPIQRTQQEEKTVSIETEKEDLDIAVKEESHTEENKNKLKQIFSKSKKKVEKEMVTSLFGNIEETAEKEFIAEKESEKYSVTKELESAPVQVITEVQKPVTKEEIKPNPVEKISIDAKKEALVDVFAKTETKQDFATKLQHKSITDINQEVGLAEKMLYINKLFEKKAEKYTETVVHLNQCTNYEEALSYLKENLSWNEEDETTQSFLNLVKRKF